MDLQFSVADLSFREEVRTWLEENAPKDRPQNDRKALTEYDINWQKIQWAGGYAGISWPAEYGGRGASLTQQLVWFEECGRAGIPGIDTCFVGINHAGPTLIASGTDEQKSFHLPKILRGDVIWCQGFSEPGSGSDLASLSTRGIIDGDELAVTGQKIWTSFGDKAQYQELLVRTDASGSKHKGITWIIGDMSAPGIEVRPIETMAGDADFCEVFYDEARFPLTSVVGRLNDGWNVAMSTLSFERGTAFMLSQVALAQVVEELIDVARTHTGPDGRRPAIADDEISRHLAQTRADVAALRAMTYLSISRGAKYGTPGPEGSISKLRYSDLSQRVGRLAIDVLGHDALNFRSRSQLHSWVQEYLRSYAASIGGGTSEIQRNIIGDRVLGLPR